MALEPGGYADKLGNRYEGRWVARQLLRLLDETLTSVCVEAIGDDEAGVDLWVEFADGRRQAQQCKVRNAGHEKWTFADLNARDIISAMQRHLDRDARYEFALVSPIEGKLVQDICQSARDSGGDPEAFFTHQIQAVGDERRKAFGQFCGYLGLDPQRKTDRVQAFDYLRRLYIIHGEDDLESRHALNELAQFLVVGEPELVIAALADFALDNLRGTIGPVDVRKFLSAKGLRPRRLTHDERVWPAVHGLQDRFRDSIKPGLIAGDLLPRVETQEVINALRKTGLVVLHGGPGSGKSGVLYELAGLLEQCGHPCLPVRLDRQVPQNNTRQFGQDLGLPESPASCLEAIASTDLSVLVIDQLDAIRWTARHSLNALEVCKSLVEEVLAIRSLGKAVGVVLACRTFDLEHDPEIKAWLQQGTEGLRKVE